MLTGFFVAAQPVGAIPTGGDAARLCDGAARNAARRHDVPLNVLQAITRTETGRAGTGGLSPWPWTVNMEGNGVWFGTEDEARAFVFEHFKRGARSFDVGCFQINFKWHGDGFRSIDDMFDPQQNADYAAALLKRLYAELGNWSDAAGAYHSRTPEFATRYAARFDRIRSGLNDDPGSKSPENAHAVLARVDRDQGQPRPGRIAPLIGSGKPSLGSLVPLGGANRTATALIASN